MTAADKLLLVGLLIGIGSLFGHFWSQSGTANSVAITGPNGREIFPLNQQREIQAQGRLGESHIRIAEHAVRFVSSPCPHKVCQRSGWHRRAGAVAACVPNRISLVLLGSNSANDLDAISY